MSSNNFAIKLENVSKLYKTKEGVFNSLNNLSFTANASDVIGLIGKNGSGKSTLLNLLSGISKPSSGKIHKRGKYASILDVGFGFHPDLTGRENIFFYSKFIGTNTRYNPDKIDAIISFSELNEFINQPVRTYSSGMYLRLAISIALHSEADILLIDEVLSVGDSEFRIKIHKKINEFKNQGTTIILASHNMNEIQMFCNKAFLLEKGNIVFSGNSFDCIQMYSNTIFSSNEKMLTSETDSSIHELYSWNWEHNNRPGNDIVRIDRISIHPKSGSRIFIESAIIIHVEFEKLIDVYNIQLLLLLHDAQFFPVLYSVTFDDAENSQDAFELYPSEKGKFMYKCEIPEKFLNHGTYNLQLRFGNSSNDEVYIHNKFFRFNVNENPKLKYPKLRDFNVPLKPKFKWEYERLVPSG